MSRQMLHWDAWQHIAMTAEEICIGTASATVDDAIHIRLPWAHCPGRETHCCWLQWKRIDCRLDWSASVAVAAVAAAAAGFVLMVVVVVSPIDRHDHRLLAIMATK